GGWGAGTGARAGGRADAARLPGAGGGVRLRWARARAESARADRVAPADRALDDRRQRSGGATFVRVRDAVLVSRARAPRARAGAAAGRTACVAGCADPGC